MKAGRKTKYRKLYCSLLIKHMTEGLSFESFAGVIGVNRDTLYAWTREHNEFSDAKRLGLAKGLLFWERMSIEALTGRLPGFNSTVWSLSMKNRFGWRDRLETDEHINVQPSVSQRQFTTVELLDALAEIKRLRTEKASQTVNFDNKANSMILNPVESISES